MGCCHIPTAMPLTPKWTVAMTLKVYSKRDSTGVGFTSILLVLCILSFGRPLAQSITLQWDSNTEPDLAGYNIYRSTSSGAGYIQLNPSLTSATSFEDTAVETGSVYYYVVTAVNTSQMESSFSNEIASNVTVPSNNPPQSISRPSKLRHRTKRRRRRWR